MLQTTITTTTKPNKQTNEKRQLTLVLFLNVVKNVLQIFYGKVGHLQNNDDVDVCKPLKGEWERKNLLATSDNYNNGCRDDGNDFDFGLSLLSDKPTPNVSLFVCLVLQSPLKITSSLVIVVSAGAWLDLSKGCQLSGISWPKKVVYKYGCTI